SREVNPESGNSDTQGRIESIESDAESGKEAEAVKGAEKVIDEVVLENNKNRDIKKGVEKKSRQLANSKTLKSQKESFLSALSDIKNVLWGIAESESDTKFDSDYRLGAEARMRSGTVGNQMFNNEGNKAALKKAG